MQNNIEKRKMAVVVIAVIIVLLGSLFINKVTLDKKSINQNRQESENQNQETPKEDDNHLGNEDDYLDNNKQENNNSSLEEYYPIKPTISNGNSIDKEKPKVVPNISLLGSDIIYVEINSNYEDLGAIAEDSIDGNITDKIIIYNSVDLTKLGTYTISYYVSNTSGQSASVERTIVVFDDVSPIITVNQEIDKKLVFLDANRNLEFINHEITVWDNSNHDISLEISYWYHPFIGNAFNQEENDLTTLEYTKVEKLDLSQLGIYQLDYVAVDESGNRSDKVSVWYMVRDVKGPTIKLSVMGTSYAMINPKTIIDVFDDFSDKLNTYYAWSTSNKIAPVDYQNIANHQEVSPSNGIHYLWVKAVDEFGNTTVLVSDKFEKDDTLLKIQEFKTKKENHQSFIQIGLDYANIKKIDEISQIKLSLYHDEKLIASAVSNDKLYNLSLNQDKLSLRTKIVIQGEKDESSVFDVTEENGRYHLENPITTLVVTLIKDNGQVLEVESTSIDESNIWWEQLFVDFDYLVGKNRGDYSTIQEAINEISNDKLLYLLPDTYIEDLTISKNVIILGTDKEKTIIKGTTSIMGNIDVSLVNLTLQSSLESPAVITLNDGTLQMVDSIIEDGKVGINATGNAILRLNGVLIKNFVDSAIIAQDNVSCNITDSEIIGTTKNENGIILLDNASSNISNSIFSNLNYGIRIHEKCKDNVKLGEGITFSNCIEDLHMDMDDAIDEDIINDDTLNQVDTKDEDLETNDELTSENLSIENLDDSMSLNETLDSNEILETSSMDSITTTEDIIIDQAIIE